MVSLSETNEKTLLFMFPLWQLSQKLRTRASSRSLLMVGFYLSQGENKAGRCEMLMAPQGNELYGHEPCVEALRGPL